MSECFAWQYQIKYTKYWLRNKNKNNAKLYVATEQFVNWGNKVVWLLSLLNDWNKILKWEQ